MDTNNWTIGQHVQFRQQRCPCVGGGFMDAEGTIVGTINNQPNWFKIDQPQGIVVVKRENIIKEIPK